MSRGVVPQDELDLNLQEPGGIGINVNGDRRPTLQRDQSVTMRAEDGDIHAQFEQIIDPHTLFFIRTPPELDLRHKAIQGGYSNLKPEKILEAYYRDQLFSNPGNVFRNLMLSGLLLFVCGILPDADNIDEPTDHLISQLNRRHALGILTAGAGLLMILFISTARLVKLRSSQFLISVVWIIAGILWLFGGVLSNRETAASFSIAYLLIGHLIGKLYLFPFIFVSSWILVVIHIIFAATVSVLPIAPCLSQIGFVVLTNSMMCLANYQHESYRRQSFLTEQKLAKKTRELTTERLDLRSEIFNMVLETKGLADMDKDVDLKSPVEKAMAILKEMLKPNTNLPKDAFFNVKRVISYLGSSSDIFRPKAEQVLEAKRVDPTTRLYLAGFLDEHPENKLRAHEEGKQASEDRKENLVQPVSDAIQQYFAQEWDLDGWSFDVFDVAEKTSEPLLFVSFKIFLHYQLINKFNIDPRKLESFLKNIESGYKGLPYHNSTHAADVERTVHFFLSRGQLRQCMTDLEILSALIASAIHDCDHPGQNNNYLIRSRHDLAILYNDKSVLENHHCAFAFGILLKDENNIFLNMTAKQFEESRKIIIEMVLATDLSHHFEHVGHFKNMIDSESLTLKTCRQSDASVRQVMLKMALKCADVGHAAKPVDLHIKWSNRAFEEFFRQGDEERRHNLAVSPFMDRHRDNVPKGQVGFIDFLVYPMYDLWFRFLDLGHDVIPCIKHLTNNRSHWSTLDNPNATTHHPPNSSQPASSSSSSSNKSEAATATPTTSTTSAANSSASPPPASSPPSSTPTASPSNSSSTSPPAAN